MKRVKIFFGPVLLILLLAIAGCGKKSKTQLPGKLADGSILLPNHYKLTPAGKQIPVGDLPLNMVLSPDGKMLAVTNNGFSRQFVSILDVKSARQVQTLPVRASFFGLAFSADGQKLFASGGGANCVYVFTKKDSQFVRSDSLNLTPNSKEEWFVTGVAVSRKGDNLFVATKTAKKLLKYSLKKRKILKSLPFDHFLYDVLLVPNQSKLYVSVWGGKAVAVVDPNTLTLLKTIRVGSHPNKMVLAPDGRLFVANANTDNVSEIDTETDSVLETISVAPYPKAPYGTTPNGLAVTPDAKTLFVANADNNDVTVVDISQKGNARVKGFIPAGWYPTAAAVSASGDTLFVANGKGIISKANPKGPQPIKMKGHSNAQYIGRLLWGTVAVLPVPDSLQLASFTEQVKKNNGWNGRKEEKERLKEKAVHAIPRHVGEPSPIKHVVYIIKENRTYDQVFGDLPQGNGDSTLAILGRTVTPNHHKLVENFVLFDNFYVDAEVSADGHEWSTAAIATDFVEKTWPTTYSGRGKGYPAEGNYKIAFPEKGYIWDAAARAGISYRSYAEFIKTPKDTAQPGYTNMKNLQGHFDPHFRPWDLNYMDIWRAREFIRELHQYEKSGDWPNLMIMRLPNDHTYGTTPGKHTPRSMVADNDLALGMVVDAISHSKFWKETAIFVLEDDAQNGPDHVDAHRSVLLAISPYTRHGYVDHNMYDTASVLKTIELILGLPPMSQYDAAAFPLIPAFQDKPNLAPYTHLKNTYPLDRFNTKTAFGARRSLKMDFREEDETPELALNQVIWGAIKGANVPFPKIHHARYEQLFN